jgi:hypothetical protein
MAQIKDAALAHELKRWMRPDAHRFVRPDWRHFVRPGFEKDHPFALYERKYREDQLRDDRGRWADEGGAGEPTPSSSSRRETTEFSAQGRRAAPPGGSATGGQAARLVVAEAQAREALARVRELDPTWRPTPSIRETVEGQIAAARAETREAQARLSELASAGIGPGPHAGESIPARGPERDFTAAERREINRIGSETGCHTCGTLEPGTKSGNFVLDHQPANALNYLGRSQRLYPHCIFCSDSQGGWISGNRRNK